MLRGITQWPPGLAPYDQLQDVLQKTLATASASHVVKRPRNVEMVVMTVQHHKVIVWFDGSCPLCTREIAFMRKLDRKNAISFIDVMSNSGNCPVDRARLLARFHAEEDGRMLSGAAAFAAMWRAIPLLRPVGVAARNRWVLAGLERAYILFLRHRPKLQRLVTWLERKTT